MKKRLLSVLLVGAMAFSLAACGGGGSDDSGSGSGGDSGSDEGGSGGGDKLVVWTWDPAFNIPAIEEAGKIYKDTVKLLRLCQMTVRQSYRHVQNPVISERCLTSC